MRRGVGVSVGWSIVLLTLGAIVVVTATSGASPLIANPAGAALQIGIAFVLTFLVVLIVRYLLLLWLGYLQHIENRGLSDERTALPPVTILVPVYNEEAVIVAALRSLLALRYPTFHVIVIDDGSTDRTFERASEVAGCYGNKTVRVLRKTNSGKASALNVGIAAATTPFILCMDGDSRLHRDTLRFAMRHFVDPRIGAVAGNVKVVNRHNLWTRLQALEYIEGLNTVRRSQGFLRVVNIIPGPIGVFRREALIGAGGYDTDTFAEDADLTLKLLTAGWHIAYEERAIAYTEAPERYLDLVKQRYRWTRGILQALRKRVSWLGAPKRGIAVWLSLLVMLFEAVLWPAMNVLGNLLFTLAALSAGVASGVFYWWALLTMLDVAAALYAIGMEGEDLRLVPYAVAYRFFFITMIDVAKLFAVVEELARVRMTWGKLERVGRL
jgi:cellulose synthase/poly-beta-1,6-N-acetylglucosamine synthase-like glycosyltransferase